MKTIVNKQTEKVIKKITISSYILIGLCIILAVSIPHAHAGLETTFGSLMVRASSYVPEDVFNKFTDNENMLFSLCVGTSTSRPVALNAFGALYDTFKAVGFLLAISVGMGRLFQKMERGQEGAQMVITCLMGICITGMFIINIDKISGLLGELGLEIMKGFLGTAGDAGAQAAAREEYQKTMQTLYTGTDVGAELWGMKTNLSFAGVGIVNMIGYYGVTIMVLSKFLEIAIMRMFAPLAMYDVYDEGLRSSGAMYLKRYLSLFIALAMSCFVARMSTMVALAFSATGWSAEAVISSTNPLVLLKNLVSGSNWEKVNDYFIGVPTVANFICLKFMKNTDEYAKAVLGVH